MKSGSDHNTNIVAKVSSVSVFAFVDKQGVITETQKYVKELGVLDQKESRVVIDLQHNQEIPEKEAEVYIYEGAKDEFKDSAKVSSVLSLAIMLSRNPSEVDGPAKLKELFMPDDAETESESVRQKPGFHFHNSAWQENEFN